MISFLSIYSLHLSATDIIGTWEGKWNDNLVWITFEPNGLYILSYRPSDGLIFKGHWRVEDNQLFITEVNRLILFEWIFKRIDRKRLKFNSNGTIMELTSTVKIKIHD